MRYAVRIVVLCFCLVLTTTAHAETTESLEAQIQSQNDQIAALDKEIAQYEAQLQTVSSKKQTLQNTLTQLDLSRKKLTASISRTKGKINTTQLQIQELSRGIARKEGSIEDNRDAIAAAMRKMNAVETQPIIGVTLSSENLVRAWDEISRNRTLQEAVGEKIDTLATEKASLTETKTTSEAKKTELLKQQRTLVAEQGSLDATRKAQQELLTQTKSQESNYQKLIADKQAAKAIMEQALSDLKTKFQYQVDLSAITGLGAGILSWPLESVRITQYFGNTAFARSGAYNGKGHNGVDFAARIGTPIKAARFGVVVGTGNTDVVRGCYSFGKWVMVKHDNGLATLYAHLSQITVSQGEGVSTGDVLGYSGQTGFATGPHLHFAVYVASATQIVTLGSATNKQTACANALMPVAPLSGYLNPMAYLPNS